MIKRLAILNEINISYIFWITQIFFSEYEFYLHKDVRNGNTSFGFGIGTYLANRFLQYDSGVMAIVFLKIGYWNTSWRLKPLS